MGGFCLRVELHREGSVLPAAQQACFMSPESFSFNYILVFNQNSYILRYFFGEVLPDRIGWRKFGILVWSK